MGINNINTDCEIVLLVLIFKAVFQKGLYIRVMDNFGIDT